jgi:hypothetical protein
LQNIATEDLATPSIEQSLLNATTLGKQKLKTFVQERLVTARADTGNEVERKKFHSSMQRNNLPTFASLYEVKQQGKAQDKQKVMKADRSVLHRLVVAYQAGRQVDIDHLLEHELMPVPVAIAEMNGTLKTGNKALLVEELTTGIDCPQSVMLEGTSCLIVDGQAQVNILGKPKEASTFGQLADIFVQSVLRMGQNYDRIDVVFDRYRETSIKSGTRDHRTRKCTPIRRVIEHRNVPLPSNWGSFMAVPENKADLACFLSEELMLHAPDDKVVITGGGFKDAAQVQASRPEIDVQNLESDHEEGDTRIILHAIHCDADNIMVAARDTDVLVLMIAHASRMKASQIWMRAGTANRRKYIPIHEVIKKIPVGAADHILAFHALTGCDTTSYFSGHTKKNSLQGV